jgi:hypothetical protein
MIHKIKDTGLSVKEKNLRTLRAFMQSDKPIKNTTLPQSELEQNKVRMLEEQVASLNVTVEFL